MSIGKNTTVGLFTDVAVLGLGVLVSIVLTRSLGPEQRGVYALLVATNGLGANLAGLSVANSCSTMLARGNYRLGQVNTVAMLLALVLGAAGLAITTLIFPLLSNNIFMGVPYTYLFIALLLLPTTIYQIYWNSMMMGLSRLLSLNKLNLTVNVVSSVLMIVVVGVLHKGIPGFLAVWSLSGVWGAISTAVVAARIERPVWPPSRKIMSDMLQFGLRGHGANIAHQIFLRLDLYLVNPLVGNAGVGFYSLSTSLAEKLWVPLNAIYASSVGKIAQLPREESALLTAKVARTAVLMMFTFALPLAVASPWLIPLIYSSRFTASVLPLIILLGGTLGFAVMLVLNNYIVGQMQRPGLLSIISWLELIVSVILYVTLIPWQGIVGAAVASTLTYLLAMAGTLYLFVRDSGLLAMSVLLPRRGDFGDYARIIKAGMRRVPGLRRYAHSSADS